MSHHNPPQQMLEQSRARHALSVVKQVIAEYPFREDKGKRVPDKKAAEFARHARKLPMRIISSGLGQAIAFLKAKEYAPLLVLGLSHWVLTSPRPKALDPNFRDDLLDKVIHGSAEFLRQSTDETIAYMQWLNRLSEAEGLTATGSDDS